MRKSERLRLIDRLAPSLAERDYDDIDRVLREYGGRISDFWDGSREEYVRHGLGTVDDDDLEDLADYVGTQPEPEPEISGADANAEPLPGGPWEPGMFRLFLSHTHAHAAAVSTFKEQLRAFNIDGFVAHVDIEPSKLWEAEIESALRTCDALAAVLSKDYASSKWCDQEVGWALGRPVRVIAIKLDQSPYGFIGKWQALPGNAPDLVERVLAVLLNDAQTARRLANAFVYRFEHSDSFADARANVDLLRRVPANAWDVKLAGRVRDACAKNGQIVAAYYGSGTVPGEAAAILKAAGV